MVNFAIIQLSYVFIEINLGENLKKQNHFIIDMIWLRVHNKNTMNIMVDY